MDADIGNGAARLLLGDCLDRLRELADCSVDSVVCDPPYGLNFMGKKWDYDVPSVDIWRECLRVLKPGGHLLAFAGTRTQHRMAVNIEDAGFEIRDMIAWIYGSGFPKSMDVSKAIDKAAGEARAVVGTVDPRGTFDGRKRKSAAINTNWRCAEGREDLRDLSKKEITTPATDAARQWQGWGTALKPALEPITVARKPLVGTVAANVLAHGTGAMNIDACRVPFAGDDDEQESKGKNQHATFGNGARSNTILGDMGQNARENYNPPGRWPANLIHDGSEEVVALFPNSNGAGGSVPNVKVSGYGSGIGTGESQYFGGERTKVDSGSGSAARFFYCAKASRKDRHEGLENPVPQFKHGATLRKVENTDTKGNHHPTVKPTDLMRYLCRLVTPTGGVVLDPFTGSGSTGKAAMLEGFRFIGCELSPDYLEIAHARIQHAYNTANPEPAEPEEPVQQLPLFA